MLRKSVLLAAAAVGLAVTACSKATLLPDAQLRAPGERLHDGGLGLGSGGFTGPTTGGDSIAGLSSSSAPAGLSAAGFGLGSGG